MNTTNLESAISNTSAPRAASISLVRIAFVSDNVFQQHQLACECVSGYFTNQPRIPLFRCEKWHLWFVGKIATDRILDYKAWDVCFLFSKELSSSWKESQNLLFLFIIHRTVGLIALAR
jgi:hypothetical protein